MGENRIFPSGEIFHICNKSISNYKIFRTERFIQRFITTINYYNSLNIKTCLSKAIRQPLELPHIMSTDQNRIFSLLAYCIMPDHYHLMIKVKHDYVLSEYMKNIENSYSHYFNLFNHRKGPLWQSRFRAILIEDDETLLHVHRYIHLNSTTAGIVENPENWPWSSYNYFLNDKDAFSMHKEISISSASLYKKFVEDQIDYQRKLLGIKRMLLE